MKKIQARTPRKLSLRKETVAMIQLGARQLETPVGGVATVETCSSSDCCVLSK